MKPLAEQQSQQSAFEYLHEKVGYKSSLVDKMQNVKNSQFSSRSSNSPGLAPVAARRLM